MNRRNYRSKDSLYLLLLMMSGLCLWSMSCSSPSELYQANGIKIGEVTQTSAIIWTRLTKNPERKTDGLPFPLVAWEQSEDDESVYLYPGPQIPVGHKLAEMANTVPGTGGQVRITYWQSDDRENSIEKTKWQDVDPERDYTYQFKLKDLKPSTRYDVLAECRKDENSQISMSKVSGGFLTAPDPENAQRVVFTVVTGQGFHRRDDKENGHKIYPLMRALDPSFFAHTGDILYYDKRRPVAHSIELARLKWNRMYAMPFQRAFHNNVASYFIKDDHDTWQNDCWPAMSNDRMRDFTFAQGQNVFLEQVPMGDKTYRTIRWGKDLQIWLVEGRDFRSPNDMPDGPEKTIWGPEQKEWFIQTVQESDVTFRVLISPTPLVGPDRENKNDNHANKGFAFEGKELRRFISKQKNMVVICGDRHWQYVSIDPETGLREYSCGPTSDEHAGGFRESLREPKHQYLNICGGFLSGTVERVNGSARLVFRHHSVDGEILNEDTLPAVRR